jgi:hypothetical protein
MESALNYFYQEIQIESVVVAIACHINNKTFLIVLQVVIIIIILLSS